MLTQALQKLYTNILLFRYIFTNPFRIGLRTLRNTSTNDDLLDFIDRSCTIIFDYFFIIYGISLCPYSSSLFKNYYYYFFFNTLFFPDD